MVLEIVDYNKTFETNVESMLKEQWNVSFCHNSNIIGKVAVYNKQFAGVCFGYEQKDYFYLDSLCVSKNYWNKGIGTQLLSNLIQMIKNDFNRVKAYLLDNDGLGSNIPKSKSIFEKCGFKFVKIIPNFFAKENNFDYCPDCKHKPCICAAWEYELKLN